MLRLSNVLLTGRLRMLFESERTDAAYKYHSVICPAQQLVGQWARLHKRTKPFSRGIYWLWRKNESLA